MVKIVNPVGPDNSPLMWLLGNFCILGVIWIGSIFLASALAIFLDISLNDNFWFLTISITIGLYLMLVNSQNNRWKTIK